MQYLPLFADVKNRPCLVVGGGDVAYRKARHLIHAGARVTLVAPEIKTELEALLQNADGSLVWREFAPSDLDGQYLVVAATDDIALNTRIYQAATQANILVNAVDDPKRSNFIFPALVDRGAIQIAISSGGKAPVLARSLREKLEAELSPRLGDLAQLAGEFREKVKAKFERFSDRRHFWEKALRGSVASLVEAGQLKAARGQLQDELNQSSAPEGFVSIVGAGPGSADLLTLKALRCLQQADVILYDHLVSDEIMALGRKDADYICVGKRANKHTLPQQEISQLMADKAKAGLRVCRIKGGDPFIFGRGGEEAQLLVEQGIAFDIVPGVTAAAGCAAYAGIPLTHRDYAQSVSFVTGHCQKDGKEPDWPSLAISNHTLVVYMGLMRANDIAAKLISAGRAPSTPVAVVANGTRQEQQVMISTLAELGEALANRPMPSPALLIIGEVVKLHQTLDWTQAESAAIPLANQA